MHLGQRLVAAQQAQDGRGFGADQVQLALRLHRLAVAHDFGDLAVRGVNGVCTLKLAAGVDHGQTRQVHLGQNRQLSGHAALVSQGDTRFGQLHLCRAGEQVHQIERHLHAGFVPVAVEQVVVGVVLGPVVEGQIGEHAHQGPACFFAGNAPVVMLFAQISVFEQGHFFQLLHRDLRDFVANVFQVRRGNLDGLSQGGIDQRCQIHLGRRQLLVDRLEQAHVLQQLTLIAQGLQRIAHALGSRFARIVQGFFSKSDGFLHIGFEQLGTGRAPVGRAHVLHQQMHGFAALFSGNHESITLLFGAVIAHAKVHQAPGQAQISGAVVAFSRRRTAVGVRTGLL